MPAFKDLTGERFGRYVAIERAPNRGTTTYWSCRCDCSVLAEVSMTNLQSGRATSCGCSRRSVDLAGATFGSWTVLRVDPTRYISGGPRWICACECGTERILRGATLLDGESVSCGCWRGESPVRNVRMRAAFVEHVDRDVVYERDGGLCQICHELIGDSRWEVDHIVAIAKGGEHSYANVQLAHLRCNRTKYDH